MFQTYLKRLSLSVSTSLKISRSKFCWFSKIRRWKFDNRSLTCLHNFRNIVAGHRDYKDWRSCQVMEHKACNVITWRILTNSQACRGNIWRFIHNRCMILLWSYGVSSVQRVEVYKIVTNASLGIYSLKGRRRLTGIGIPIVNLRRSGDRLRFIKGIPIPITRCLLGK